MALCAALLAIPASAHADPAETVACAALCRAQVKLSGATVENTNATPWPAAHGMVEITITNTSAVSPPLPIMMNMAGDKPTFQIRVINDRGFVQTWSTGFFIREGGEYQPLPETHVLMPGQSITFHQRIVGVTRDIKEIQLMRDDRVVATLNARFEDYHRTQLYLFKNGLISDLVPGVPLPAGAERFEGDWVTSTGTRVSLARDGDVLRGRLFPAGGRSPISVVAHASDRDDQLITRLQDGAGQDLDHLFLQLQPHDMLAAKRVFDTRPTARNMQARDVAWSASRPSAPPSQPRPTPPEPAPPVDQPTPPVTQPAPPVVQPTPPANPRPQPPVPQPQPPTPVPPGAGGGSWVGGQGGFQGISRTWDVQFDGARVERDSEVHVFMSVKNRSTSDQYITPGTFIPNLGNQDGETITSRAVFRASGDTPTEFRPTVPADGEVRVRFIFRPDAGTAQPRAFTLESFGHRKLTFDVSGLRVGSLGQ